MFYDKFITNLTFYPFASRMTSLLKGGVIAEDNLPAWYNVYKAFPPKYEPCFSRSKSEKEIKNIFYEEDQLRA